MSDRFCYHTINDWKKLIDQEDKKNTILITIPILTTICIYIGLIKFLKERPFEIEYDADSAFCEKCLGLDWYNNYEKEVAEEVINKADDNKTPKQKAIQMKKEK